jgi:hypothetical protein
MKKSRYTESQIIGVLKEVDAGMKVEEVCRTIETGTIFIEAGTSKQRTIEYLSRQTRLSS